MAAYKKIEHLGSGGFSDVWSCLRDDDEMVAVKFLRETDADATHRFEREVDILQMLDHPRVVKLLDDLSEPERGYVMPLYASSLEQHMTSLMMDRDRIAVVFDAILEGMEYAHNMGVIHRDLKPRNILMNDDTDVVIADFGLGRRVDSASTRATSPIARMGTSGYMAPEQYQDAYEADARSDVYSLGRILHEMYTGSIYPALNRTSLPPVIAIIVNRCTQVDPQKRYDSAGALRAALALARSKTTSMEADEFLKQAIEGHFASVNIERLAKAIIGATENRELLHKTAVNITAPVFSALYANSPDAAKLLANQFGEQALGEKNWSFDYIDVIADTARKLFEAVDDDDIRTQMFSITLQCASNFYRYHAMDVAAQMIEAVTSDKSAMALIEVLQPLAAFLSLISDRVNHSRLNPHIRALFMLSGGESSS